MNWGKAKIDIQIVMGVWTKMKRFSKTMCLLVTILTLPLFSACSRKEYVGVIEDKYSKDGVIIAGKSPIPYHKYYFVVKYNETDEITINVSAIEYSRYEIGDSYKIYIWGE